MTAIATMFAALTVTIPRTMVVSRATFDATNGVRKLRAWVELFNNVANVERVSGYIYFNGTKATAEGVSRAGFDVRRCSGDLYIFSLRRVGVRIVD